MIKQAWRYFFQLREMGWDRDAAKALAAAYLVELRWDAERAANRQAAVKRDALMRGGQI